MTTQTPPRGSSEIEQPVQPAIESHWYTVANDGRATLCANEQEAVESCPKLDVYWPHRAPHKALLLGDVAAERERCASICDELARVGDSRDAAACAAAIRGHAGPLVSPDDFIQPLQEARPLT